MPQPGDAPKAVVLVGGPGTRLRPLTYEMPKSMVPVLNRPVMEHTIAYLKQHGIGSVVLAMSYLPDAIRDYFGDGAAFETTIDYCLEETLLGTAGAVKNAERYLSDTFVVLNGDVFTDLDITEMLEFHRRQKARATIALRWVDDVTGFGVVETAEDRRVRRFVEKPPPEEATTHWINAGVYILEPEVLRQIPAGTHFMFENGLFPRLLDLGEPVYGYPFTGYWLDMGTPGKYLSLNCDLLLAKTSSPLLPHPPSGGDPPPGIDPGASIIPPVLFGEQCLASAGSRIRGPVVMGSGCSIEEGASVESSTLWSDVIVGAGAVVSECVIGSGVRIAAREHLSDCVVTTSHRAELSRA